MSNRIYLSQKQKTLLEELVGTKILQRNVFDLNQNEIQDLSEQGKKNAEIYLERNRLGQKLSIFDDNRLYTSVVELGEFLKMSKIPREIECYDITHLSGKFVYGSMVKLIDGRPVNKLYRLFKCKEQNNDFENHAEVMRRRLKRGLEYENGETKDKAWKLPDLIIVDGGKGQLSSDYKVLVEFGLENEVQMVSLAKKEEEIFGIDMSLYNGYKLGREGGLLLDGEIKFLVQRVRDEAHRFGIKNNRNARLKTISKSKLDDIAGIGEVTKNKLLKQFSSTENIIQNLYENPELIYELVGSNIVKKLKKAFGVL
jgi:excinuclease ABC subunit C